ncbi:MAG: DUF4105 domain-containing protein [Psychrobacter sp.]|nr:DUF4105 domain-containing protein [Psychrobacter sp.]
MSIIQNSPSTLKLPKTFHNYACLPLAIAALSFSVQAQAFLPTPESVVTTGILSDTAESKTEQLLETWRTQVQADNLAQHTTWRRLLYFVDDKKGVFAKNTNKSLIDSKSFYLAANGQKDSAAELDATLIALAQELTTPTINNNRVAADDSVLCRFPARVQWLTKNLKIEDTNLQIDCPKLDAWMTELAPQQLSVMFAAEYLDNPISAFAHTLLRIDSPASSKDFTQIHHAYALNYTVDGDTADNFVLYAIKSASGSYDSRIEIDPYPKKLAEYLKDDERDTWTYPLALTPSEVQQIMLHVWETKDLKIPYYFATDNCASEILRLIDVVRPNQHLLSKLPYAVIPSDVINLLEKEKLLGSGRYTPADSSLRQAQLNQANQATSDYENQLGYRRKSIADLKAIKSVKLNASSIMSADGKILSPLTIAPSNNNPLDRHPLQRAHIGLGKSGDNSYIDVGLRAGFHDTLDHTAGFDQFFDLEGLAATLRLYDTDSDKEDQPKSVELQNFTLLRGRSYNPVNSAQKGQTWGATIEATRINDGSQQGGTGHLVASTTLEYGKSWAFGTPRIDASGLMTGEMPPQLCYTLATGALQGGRGINKGYRAGVGINAGCIYEINNQLRAQAQLQLPYWYHGSSDQADVQGSYWQPIASFGLQYDIDKKQALRLNASYEWQDRIEANEDFSLAYMRYF